MQNFYGTNCGGADFEMGKVIKQVWGGQSPTVKLHYAPHIPAAGNQFAILKTILNDPAGQRHPVLLRRAQPVRPATRLHRPGRPDPHHHRAPEWPASPLRGTDPAYFETLAAYTADSLPALIVSPNGNSISNCYERLLNPAADPRARGNLRVRTRQPGPFGGDQSLLVEQYQYGPVYGGCCGVSFVTNYVDAASHVTRHAYDSHGNRTNTTYAVTGVAESWEYNAFGQVTAHVLPANGSGYTRRDEFLYDGYGYLQQQVVDAAYLRLTTYFGNDSLGNVRFLEPTPPGAPRSTLSTRLTRSSSSSRPKSCPASVMTS